MSRSRRRCAVVAALASPAGALASAGVRVAIGQDLWSIRNYTARFGAPDAVMSYASIGNLSGLWSPTDYGSGVEYADGALAGLPARTALQLGLELKGHEAALAGGDLDANVGALVAYVASLAPRHVLVRIGYEFDMPGNLYVPEAYKAAYRVVAEALADTPNAFRVWHSWSFAPWEADGGRGVGAWYPGDGLVDYCGVSVFQQAYGDSELGDLTYAHAMADFCDEKRIPLIIAESTPFGAGVVEPYGTLWARWFEPTLRFAKARGVVLWSYIDCDWDSQPMWRGMGWGDSRLEVRDALAAKWEYDVLDPYPNATRAFFSRVSAARPPGLGRREAVYLACYLPVLGLFIAFLMPAPEERTRPRAASSVDEGHRRPFVLASPEAATVKLSDS